MKTKGASRDKIILKMLRSSVCKVRVTEATQTSRHRPSDTDPQTNRHSKLVFYAQSTGTVISGRKQAQTDRHRSSDTDLQTQTHRHRSSDTD